MPKHKNWYAVKVADVTAVRGARGKPVKAAELLKRKNHKRKMKR